MDDDPLFLATIDDLRHRAERRDEYGVVKAAGLLRLLLLDGTPLVARVNRVRRLRIRYRVFGNPALLQLMIRDGATFWAIEDGLYPPAGSQPFGVGQELKLDELLRLTVMLIEGHEVSARDLIRHVAHVEGGVHAGAPEDATQQAIGRAARSMRIGQLPAGTRTLAAIGRAVAAGLDPLADQIRKDATGPT
jgi:hypothetical protein